MSKPKVNQELCIGCGTCEALCPTMFKVENGKSQVIGESCEGVNCDCNEAVTSCPVSAISME
jgi:ferredoxin